jgi:hypothetical protein
MRNKKEILKKTLIEPLSLQLPPLKGTQTIIAALVKQHF